MNHPALKKYTLVEQPDYVKLYSNASSNTIIARFKESTVVSEAMAKGSIDLVLRNKKDQTNCRIADLSAKFIDFTNEAKNYYRKTGIKKE